MRKTFLFTAFILNFMFFNAQPLLSDEYDIVREQVFRWKADGIKQYEIAADLGVSGSTVSRFVNGTNTPILLEKFKSKYPSLLASGPKVVFPPRPLAFTTVPTFTKITAVTYSAKAIEENIRALNPVGFVAPLSTGVVVGAEEEVKVASFKSRNVNGKISFGALGSHEHAGEKPMGAPNASVVIASRGFADDKDGQGTFYDHITFQGITGYRTQISFPNVRGVSSAQQKACLEDYVKEIAHGLTFGEEVNGKKLPPVITNSYDGGLLVIPGRMRDREYDAVRAQHEHKVIRDALNRGQPILALCAGSWRLWQAYGVFSGAFKNIEQNLINVSDHVSSRMMNFSDATNRVVYNADIHGLTVDKNSLLARAMGKTPHVIPDRFPVNSVHWKAVDPLSTPPFLKISASSVHDPSIPERKHRCGSVMNPQINTVEAFEGIHGAPLLGIQWHPEGYYDSDARRGEREHPHSALNKKLLKFMAQAGETYARKRIMLRELSAIHTPFSLKKVEGRTPGSNALNASTALTPPSDEEEKESPPVLNQSEFESAEIDVRYAKRTMMKQEYTAIDIVNLIKCNIPDDLSVHQLVLGEIGLQAI
ncbi:MAG: gamma-glutamyl-gamma-aminobutyrate hydrolase family protein, partial [Alphaproteobacteria bacterium]